MRKQIKKVMLILFITNLIFSCSGCGHASVINDSTNDKNIAEVDCTIECIEIKREETEEEGFKGEIDIARNSFSNLNYQCSFNGSSYSYVGRVAAQGDSLYFYEQGNICAVTEDGNKVILCTAKDASSLNVYGDRLFFLEGTTIFSIKIDGTEKEEILINVYGPFFIYDNILYYVTGSNFTATKYEYYICKYFLAEDKPQLSFCVGEYCPTLVTICPENNNAVIFYYEKEPYQDPIYSAWSYMNFAVGSYDDKGNVFYKDFYSPKSRSFGDIYFWTIPTEKYLYVSWYASGQFSEKHNELICIDISNFNIIASKEDSDYFLPVNSFGNDLIFKSGTELAIVSFENIQNPSNIGFVRDKTIISEKEQMVEVYVIGEFIYYTMNRYNTSNLYRVKIDGSCWEDI